MRISLGKQRTINHFQPGKTEIDGAVQLKGRLARDYVNTLKMSAATEGRKILIYVPMAKKLQRLNWRRSDSGIYMGKAFKRKYKTLKQTPWGYCGALTHPKEQVIQHLSGIALYCSSCPREQVGIWQSVEFLPRLIFMTKISKQNTS